MNRPTHRSRRRLAAIATLAIVALAAGVPVMQGSWRDTGPTSGELASNRSIGWSSESQSNTPRRRTAQITRRDLAFTFNKWGVLGHADLRTVGDGDGVVTTLPTPGTVVVEGQTLYGIDGHDGPIMLEGALPMWRHISATTSDGPDIAQVEAALNRLGYTASDLVIDNHFTDATRRIISDFQRAHGRAVSGELGPTDIWFSPGPVRVASVAKQPGQTATGTVLSVTGLDQTIDVGLDPRQIPYVALGNTVAMTLPDGSSAQGKIAHIAGAATVTTDSNGVPTGQTISVSITPVAPLQIADGSAIILKFIAVTARDVLAAPIDAIVATVDHRFAVEVVAPDQTTTLVAVALGRNADGWVEVTGDVNAGTTVVTA